MDGNLTTCFFLEMLVSGAALGCSVCLAAGRMSGRGCYNFRFSLLMVLLSVMVGFSAYLLVKAERPSFIFEYAKNHFFVSFVYFFVGFAVSVFIKLLLPVISVLYIVVTCVTGFNLYIDFQTFSDSVHIALYRNSVSVNGNDCVFIPENDVPVTVLLEVRRIPEYFIFPYPSAWYAFKGVSVGNHEYFCDSYVNELEKNDGSHVGNAANGNLFKIYYKRFYDFLISDVSVKGFQLPMQKIHPVVFDVDLKIENTCDVVKMKKVI